MSKWIGNITGYVVYDLNIGDRYEFGPREYEKALKCLQEQRDYHEGTEWYLSAIIDA